MPKIECKYSCWGTSDIGFEGEVNEDYYLHRPLRDDVLLVGVADGMGSSPSTLQPGAIATIEMVQACERMFESDQDVFLENPTMMLQEGMYVANRVLGAFKIANEQRHSGFGCSLLAILIYDKNKFAFAQCGNTRLSLIRVNEKDGGVSIRQLTKEHTVAMELLEKGIISGDDYYYHPDRFKLSSGIGIVADPEIQLYSGRLKRGDILLATTDGVHYGIRPEAMANIVVSSDNLESASKALTKAAVMEKVPDNGTAVLIYISEES